MRCGHPLAQAPVADWAERAAMGASILCLIHCIGLSLLLAALPALSSLIVIPEQFHLWILVFAIPASGSALLLGARHHRIWKPLAAGGVGLVLLATGALLLGEGRYETPVTVLGSLCLVWAHVRNWRLRHRSHDHG